MAALNFPSSPSINDEYTANGSTWKWSGVSWDILPRDPFTIPASDTPPVSPANGDLWWNTEEGTLKIYYVDANSAQWVDTSSTTIIEATLSFPFYNSSTVQESIALTSNQNLPFFKADGTQNSITVTT